MYDRFGGLAFTLAHRIVRDPGIAEDVVQESFLAVWRNSAQFDARRGTIQAWLCQVVRNRAIDRLRGVSGRQRYDQPLDSLAPLVSCSDVESDVIQHDQSRTVKSAVAALPRAQREVIELAYYGGHTQTEIAGLTAVPLGTVKGRTRSAMRSLATALGSLRDPLPAEARPLSGKETTIAGACSVASRASRKRVTG